LNTLTTPKQLECNLISGHHKADLQWKSIYTRKKIFYCRGLISSLLKYKFSIFIIFVLQFLGLIFSNAKLLGETELSIEPILSTIFLILILVYFIYLGWKASKKFNYTTKDAGMVGAGVGIASSLLLGIFLLIISLVLVFGLIELGQGAGAVFGEMASQSGQQVTSQSGAEAGGAIGALIGTLLLIVVLITTVLNMIFYAIVGFIFSFLGGFLSNKFGNK